MIHNPKVCFRIDNLFLVGYRKAKVDEKTLVCSSDPDVIDVVAHYFRGELSERDKDLLDKAKKQGILTVESLLPSLVEVLE